MHYLPQSRAYSPHRQWSYQSAGDARVALVRFEASATALAASRGAPDNLLRNPRGCVVSAGQRTMSVSPSPPCWCLDPIEDAIDSCPLYRKLPLTPTTTSRNDSASSASAGSSSPVMTFTTTGRARVSGRRRSQRSSVLAGLAFDGYGVNPSRSRSQAYLEECWRFGEPCASKRAALHPDRALSAELCSDLSARACLTRACEKTLLERLGIKDQAVETHEPEVANYGLIGAECFQSLHVAHTLSLLGLGST
jgi:hypothetical protein